MDFPVLPGLIIWYKDDIELSIQLRSAQFAMETAIQDLNLSLFMFQNWNKIASTSIAHGNEQVIEFNEKLGRRMPFHQANSFLYALDTFYKVFRTLTIIPKIKESAIGLFNQFNASFPHLSIVRNSAQHIEDRYQQKARGKNIKVEEGFYTCCLFNNQLGYTTETGKLHYVEISENSLRTVVDIFNKLMCSLEWQKL